MNPKKKISMAVVRRLPRYYRYLGELLDNGIARISSQELSEKMNITASQIRQDLNNFGGFGQQGYGYNVEYLYEEIKKILGLTREYKLIVIGSGNLGQAIANYSRFGKIGYKICALFDIDPDLIGKKINGNDILHIDGLEDFVRNNGVDIAILTLPKEHIFDIANRLVDLEIKAVWNFTPADFHSFEDKILVEHVHLSDSLMTMSYRINELG